jgi:hypothetical protein
MDPPSFAKGVIVRRPNRSAQARASSDVISVLLVGHNPAMQDLVARAGDRGDALPDASRKFRPQGLPRSRSVTGHGIPWPKSPASSFGSSSLGI